MNRLFGTLCIVALAILFFASVVEADLYVHNPRGSNNRFNEANANRDNDNRLFDSQNNGKGGYPIGEKNPEEFEIQPMYYFGGSLLRIEWTQQHGCGYNNKTFCQLVLQYTCTNGEEKTYNGEPWTPTDGQETGNNANPPTTGYIEPLAMRTKCEVRERNKGLYVADRNLNEDTAAHTRQNNNGNQYGTECPEERDYYPYWHPTPFKDIAVFTNSPEICPYYQKHSQNVEPKGECECSQWEETSCGDNNPCWAHNNKASCEADEGNGCTWAVKTTTSMFGSSSDTAEGNLDPPYCAAGGDDYWSRDNHLGNAKNGQTPYYIWKMPTPEEACGNPDGCDKCFFRMRYNITTTDYHKLEDWQLPEDLEDKSNLDHYFWVDHRLNGSRSIKMDNASNYFENDPVVDMGVGRGLAIALNTAQTGRTFQDRSHSFQIKPAPAEAEGKTIYNLNVRGKRGNIVQAYPAVEYDFVPKFLEIDEGDLVHIQWVGSNRYPGNYAGQGNEANDRNNLMEFKSPNHNYPLPAEKWSLITEMENIKAIATSGAGDDADTQLNDASPYFDAYEAFGGKLLQPGPGTYYYGSTRNNDFTNRSHKGTLFVRGAKEDTEEDK